GADALALLQDGGPAAAMDRAIHAAAAQQRGVRCIDDGVDSLLRDVAPEQTEPGAADLEFIHRITLPLCLRESPQLRAAVKRSSRGQWRRDRATGAGTCCPRPARRAPARRRRAGEAPAARR